MTMHFMIKSAIGKAVEKAVYQPSAAKKAVPLPVLSREEYVDISSSMITSLKKRDQDESFLHAE